MRNESLHLLTQIQKIIDDYDFAITLRQLFYQLVAKQIIPNQQKYYTKLSRLCVAGRDQGMLPEKAFADRLRQVDKPSSWIDLADFMDTVRQAYRKDVWQKQHCYIEIWTEKDALRGVIAPVTHSSNVSLLVVRGQVSRTAIYESYKRFVQQIKKKKQCYLFYFGDFDPSGMSIYSSLVERLQNFGKYGDEYGQEINFQRVALTANQISIHSLPQDPAKQSDPNYKKFVVEYGDNVVELDSLPPDALRNLINKCIVQKIDFEILNQIKEIEKNEQAVLEEFVERLEI